ncbi:MAG: tol-pal system protein YbgF [Aquificae bacterium]|nr:tol-pal system protein YbgF [Aquificota bacterium]
MKKGFIFLLAGAVITVSCANQEEITTLQKEIIELKKKVATIEENQRKTQEDLIRLSNRLDYVAKVSSQNQLEIQKLKSFGGKPQQTTSMPQPTTPQIPLEKEGEEIVKMPETAEQLYRKALNEYYKGKIYEARRLFQDFIKKFKNSDLYDNALFWLGQTYYIEGQYETAIEIFDRLISQCEAGTLVDCNKLPSAMLKKGLALIKIGKIEEAKEVLSKLINQYPTSEEAYIAQKKLEALQ